MCPAVGKVILLVKLKVPGPSSTYLFCPAQELSALLIVLALPEYAPMVVPHWVQLESGTPPGMPTCDQSAARLGLITPFHNWAWAMAGYINNRMKNDRTNWL